MTKSDEYFGKEREFYPAESLTTQVPEIKTKTSLSITHNTNVNVVLVNTETTLAVTNWKQAPDFTLRCYFVPRINRGYLDNTLTCTSYPSGLHVVAGYTTAVVAPLQLFKTITFTAAKYDAIKRLVFNKCQAYSYLAYVSFTDLYGVSQSVRFYVRTTGTSQFIDLRTHKVDRSAALTIILYGMVSSDTDLAVNGSLSTPNVYFHGLDNPIDITFDMYNSIDDMALGQAPLVDEGIQAQLASYFKNFATFLEPDAKTFAVPIEAWCQNLAKAGAYAISQGWKVSTDFNNLEEAKTLSLGMVGALTKISSGMFSKDITIPEHFKDNIESALASGGNANDLFLTAALWAISDDCIIESGSV